MSMTLIQHTELTSTQTSITFMNTGNIPATFTDLLLVYSLREGGSGAQQVHGSMGLLLNSSGGTTRALWGTGSATGSGSFSGDLYAGETAGALATSDTFSNGSIYIPNYRSTVAKSVSMDNVTENNGTTARQHIAAGLSATTSAITSITLRSYGGGANIFYVAGSSATLYGITAGSSGGVVVS
jgi:hypothetical protein